MDVPEHCPACGAPWRQRSKTMGAQAGQPHQAICERGHHWHEPPGASKPIVGYDRAVLVDVLVHHYRKDSESCGCGWAVLGASHPEHVADVYEQTVASRHPTPRPQPG